MVRCRIRTLVVALVAWAGAWATPPPARAGFSITLTDMGTGAQTPFTAPVGVNTINTGFITVGNFTVDVTARTNSPGGQINGLGVADRLQDITITTSNNSFGSDTLVFQVISTGFTVPGVLGGTVEITNTLASSAVDPGGSGTLTSSVMGISTYTTPAVTLSSVGSVSSSGSFTLDANPYTVYNTMNIMLAGGDSAQFTGTTTVTAPAPPGVVLALSGIPVLGLGCWLRRRRRTTLHPAFVS